MSRAGQPRPAVFLDRDGVINRRIPDGYVRLWEKFEFLKGVPRAIYRINRMGYLTVVVTNQQGIGKGLMTIAELDEVHRLMREKLRRSGAGVNDIRYCPHLATDNCRCRKPLPGMLLDAAADLHIDLGRSYLVGDSASDIAAGRAAGVRPVFIGKEPPPGVDCPVLPDLLSFTDWLDHDRLSPDLPPRP